MCQHLTPSKGPFVPEGNVYVLESSPRGKPDRSRETTSGRKPVQWDHRACSDTCGQARTLKAARERRIGVKVPPDARLLCWLVEFAAYLTKRCDIGSDGKTPLQRLHGRRDNTPILESGEKILYIPAKPARGGKVDTAIPSWSVRWHAELFIRSSGRHRGRAGDQATAQRTSGEFLSRRDGTRTEHSEYEQFRGLQ